jgi:hypothetical protein
VVKSGDSSEKFVVRVIGYIAMKRGIRVSIMLPIDPRGIKRSREPQPDSIVVQDAKAIVWPQGLLLEYLAI